MILLEADRARAVVAIDGAEIKLWTIAGLPLIWRPDPMVWSEPAPFSSQLSVGQRMGRSGSTARATRSVCMDLRGIAAMNPRTKAESVRLQLEKRCGYACPLSVRIFLIVEHKLSGVGLQTILEVDNSGVRDMPYACGVHPGLRWPFAGGEAAAYRIRFDKAEDPTCR